MAYEMYTLENIIGIKKKTYKKTFLFNSNQNNVTQYRWVDWLVDNHTHPVPL